MLNAAIFTRKLSYSDEVSKVHDLLIDSHSKILECVKIDAAALNENFFRNILVKDFLRKNKSNFDIGYLSFEIESGEIDMNNETVGFIDIKVSNLGKKDLLDEDEYISYECKILDQTPRLNAAYINNGIYRYVIGRYSSKMPIAAMIGFVKSGSVNNIISDLRNRLSNNQNIVTHQNMISLTHSNNFNHIYESTHDRSPLSNGQVELNHIFFDISTIIN